jgi:hypothetical protein
MAQISITEHAEQHSDTTTLKIHSKPRLAPARSRRPCSPRTPLLSDPEVYEPEVYEPEVYEPEGG